MIENIKLYKNISLEIINSFENNDLDVLEDLLDERQKILDKKAKDEEFKQGLINEGILDIDKKIHTLLSESIENVKREIREHKISKKASNSYITSSKEKLNIFDQKV